MVLLVSYQMEDGLRSQMDNRYKEKIEQLENEIKDKQEEIEITNNQSTIDILEEDIYNTKQSIKELKKYV